MQLLHSCLPASACMLLSRTASMSCSACLQLSFCRGLSCLIFALVSLLQLQHWAGAPMPRCPSTGSCFVGSTCGSFLQICCTLRAGTVQLCRHCPVVQPLPICAGTVQAACKGVQQGASGPVTQVASC